MLNLKLRQKIMALTINALHLLECADELYLAPAAIDESVPLVDVYSLRQAHRDDILSRMACPLEREAFYSGALWMCYSKLTTRALYALRGQAAGVAAQGRRLLREANLSLSDVRVYGCPLGRTEKPSAQLLRHLRIMHLNIGT